jgi:tetratricopeptide (TPR) repeat protein
VREVSSVLYDMGRYDEGMTEIERALDYCRKLPIWRLKVVDDDYNEEERDIVSMGLGYRGGIGEPGAGERERGGVVVMIMGEEGREAAACIELKARLLRGMGQYEESVGCFKKAVELNELHMYGEVKSWTLNPKPYILNKP